MSTRLFYGQIVRIRVARHGQEKLRPVVVVTPNEAMAEGSPLVGVAITGTPDPPTGFEVPLPWQAQGRSRTGLDKPNAAVCRWFVTFSAADVVDALGHVPPSRCERSRRPSGATGAIRTLPRLGSASLNFPRVFPQCSNSPNSSGRRSRSRPESQSR